MNGYINYQKINGGSIFMIYTDYKSNFCFLFFNIDRIDLSAREGQIYRGVFRRGGQCLQGRTQDFIRGGGGNISERSEAQFFLPLPKKDLNPLILNYILVRVSFLCRNLNNHQYQLRKMDYFV